MNKTLDFFKVLNTIPRPSGHEEKVRDFLIKFAQDRNLEYFTDETFNVVIKKQSNCNSNKTLILQAHQDMVCEKNSNVDINFFTDAIKTKTDGDFLMAQGTTLGADNGIGLCMILSVLDDNNLKIPNIECIFSTQEETTMLGAINLNCSTLKGKHLLSIDGTDEGKIEVSSAGMVVTEISKNFEQENLINGKLLKLNLTGLRGGHSGTEIGTDRQNAIKLMFEFLQSLNIKLNIISVSGGGKSNAIPRECNCIVLAQNLDEIELKNAVKLFLNKYKNIENNINLSYNFEDLTKIPNKFLSLKDSKNLIYYVNNFKNGVLVWDKLSPNFPIVSNNFANINLTEGVLKIVISLRSSVKKLEKEYLSTIKTNAEKLTYSYKETSSAPFFERKENSYLQKLCTQTYNNLYNTKAEVHGVHAGLEGGVFAGKIPNIDICVIAPNIYDCHSPDERVSLSSVERVYKWLENIVEKF